MATFLYLFKHDTPGKSSDGDLTAWDAFIDELRNAGHFVGGGPLGKGCVRELEVTIDAISGPLRGFMVVTAESLQEATNLLDNCPTIRSGGSVEIRHVIEV